MNDSDRPNDETLTSAHGGRPADLPPIERLGDFEILGELGRGGMGVVYEARQVSLKRRVALKVLPPALGMGKDSVGRFEREAHAAAKLHHTNIVPVYAIGEEGGSHYYAMELIEGEPLDKVLADLVEHRTNPLMEATVGREPGGAAPSGSTSESSSISNASTDSDTSAGARAWFPMVARLMAAVAEALDYAHGRGVIHRDIKPGNLILSNDGRLMITDFGLARIAQEPGMTMSGSFMGTPAFMSPEQIAAGRMGIDHRTDIYSLGASLYEMLTLHRPFTGDSREEVIAGIMTKDARPPRRHNPRVPLDLETICLKAMEKDPDRRYQSAGEMANDLRQYLQGGEITARRASFVRRTTRSIRRHPVAAIGTCAVVLLAVAGVFAVRALQRGNEEEMGRLLSEARHALSQGSYTESLRKADLMLAADPDRVDARLVRARSLMNIFGRRNEAAAEAEAILADDPDDWAAHAVIVAAGSTGKDREPHVAAVERLAPDTSEALTLRASITDSPEEALTLLDRALELDPGNSDALESHAWRQINLKNFQAALDDADRLLVARPRSIEGRLLRAMCYYQLKDFDAMKQEIDKAIEADPEASQSYALRGNLWHAVYRGDIQSAEADIATALELDPDNIEHLELMSLGMTQVGRYEEALVRVERLLELDPTNLAGHRYLVNIHQALGQDDDARAVLAKLEEMAGEFSDPRWVEFVHRMRSWNFRQMGDHQQALAAADAAVAAYPEGVWAYIDRASARKHLEGEEGVIEDCLKAASQQVDTLDQLMSRAGWLRDLCRMNDRALDDLNAVIARAPHWPDPYLERAEVHYDEQRVDAMRADVLRATELAPKWKNAWAWQCSIWYQLGYLDDALEACERSIATGNLAANQTLGLTLVALGRDDDAFRGVDAVIEQAPEFQASYVVRAWLLYYTGRPVQAVEQLNRAIEVGPEVSTLPYTLRAEIGASGGGRSCDEQLADLEKALAMRSGNPSTATSVAISAVVSLAEHCPDLYDRERYEALARGAVEYDSRDSNNQYVYGSVLMTNGHYEQARQALEKWRALSRRDTSPYGHFALAMAYSKLGDRTAARGAYDHGVSIIEKYAPNHTGWNLRKAKTAKVLGI